MSIAMANMTKSQKKKKKKKLSELFPSIVKSLILDKKSIIVLGLYTNNLFLSKIS